MEILRNLIFFSSAQVRISLVKADLVPQLITTLNPLSLSFAEAVNVHACLLTILTKSVWLATPYGLQQLGIKDKKEQQAVHETILTQVLVPSEKYIRHLCMNRFSIIDGEQSYYFMSVLARHLEISPYYQPTMDFVLDMPVFLTIPSSLTFFENDTSIWNILFSMLEFQWEWNKHGRDVRQMGKTIHRLLRMEGTEDSIEEKLQNDQNEFDGRLMVANSIGWNNLQGMNLPRCY
ncbi:hypothetical protein BLNAU_12062 [Blattamonas nauphoetae]|uniref:Uncharacterized protein n=1 Tax=Blattamonas nauphoetae TaxID=2049346 RepID=A0ABQ9XP01_9EUKA|nr:hypothetical protein BLNAU_12062 [Blattamonas nauphoetae]